MDKGVWRMTEVAYYCSLRECTILRLVRQGRIPYRRLGRTWLFLPHEIETWLHALPGVSMEAAVQASYVRLKRVPARKQILVKVSGGANRVTTLWIIIVFGEAVSLKC
jgi:excisionase family DNA binding protein